MNTDVKQRIMSTRVWIIISSAFTIYVTAWAIVEPLNIEWISGHIIAWRTLLLTGSILGGVLVNLLIPGKILQVIDTNGGTIALQHTYRSTGTPSITVEPDGNFGRVAVAKGVYHTDEMDWDVRHSAQKAGKLDFIFNQRGGVMHFYLKVLLVSKMGGVPIHKWIRFDNTICIPDIYEHQEEMATPYVSTNIKNFQKVTIDIRKAVKDTFGQGGWEYERTLVFRIRGNVTIKGVVFKR